MITVTKIVFDPAKDSVKSIAYQVSVDGDAASPVAKATLPYRRQSAPAEVIEQVPDVVSAARSIAALKDHDHWQSPKLVAVEVKGPRYLLTIASEKDLIESRLTVSADQGLISSPHALAIQALISAAEGLVIDLVGGE